MKKIIVCMCALVLVFLLILAAYTIYGRNVRKKELDNALSSGLQKAMQMLNAEEYAPHSNEEFIGLFMEAFIVNFESSSDITIHILDADYEKGLLSAEAILTYKHPLGTMGTVAARKTIIREEYTDDEEIDSFVVQYMVDGILYKKYVQKAGTSIMIPKSPQGDNFLGWRRLEDDQVVSMDGWIVQQNYTFVAVFE